MATLHLADLGAEIIKIEDPEIGDYARFIGATRQTTSQFFLAINRNKTFVTLDLKSESDRARLIELVRTADALVEGFRPGVMSRLGLSWEQLSAVNPALVYCSISGYGQDGPMKDCAGHDINYLSLTGVLEQTVGRDGMPAIPALQIADLLGGAQTAVIGILAALIDARHSGQGRYVDVSMTDAVFAHNVTGIAAANANGHAPEPGRDLLTGGAPCYNVYRTSDLRYIAVGALEHKFWASLCHAINRADLADLHWSLGQEPGSAAALAVRAELDVLFATQTMDFWTQRLAPYDCCVTPILRTEEALVHPLFRARSMIVEQDDQTEGSARYAALPIRFSDDGFAVARGAQPAGADNSSLDALIAGKKRTP
jgi:alpha-methylacyl-CoA racemase